MAQGFVSKYFAKPTVTTSTYPKCRAYCSTTQSIPNGVFTKVQLDTENFDTNNNFDPTTNYRFTPTVAGKYAVSISVVATLAAAFFSFEVAIYKNGAAVSSRYWAQTFAASSWQNTVSDIVDMNGTTDYLELYIFQNSGGARTLVAGTQYTYMACGMLP